MNDDAPLLTYVCNLLTYQREIINNKMIVFDIINKLTWQIFKASFEIDIRYYYIDTF